MNFETTEWRISKIDIENNKEYIQKAEEVKKILSIKNKASTNIDGPKGLQQIEITQEEFEESIQTYIEKIKIINAKDLNGIKFLYNSKNDLINKQKMFDENNEEVFPVICKID